MRHDIIEQTFYLLSMISTKQLSLITLVNNLIDYNYIGYTTAWAITV